MEHEYIGFLDVCLSVGRDIHTPTTKSECVNIAQVFLMCVSFLGRDIHSPATKSECMNKAYRDELNLPHILFLVVFKSSPPS